MGWGWRWRGGRSIAAGLALFVAQGVVDRGSGVAPDGERAAGDIDQGVVDVGEGDFGAVAAGLEGDLGLDGEVAGDFEAEGGEVAGSGDEVVDGLDEGVVAPLFVGDIDGGDADLGGDRAFGGGELGGAAFGGLRRSRRQSPGEEVLTSLGSPVRKPSASRLEKAKVLVMSGWAPAWREERAVVAAPGGMSKLAGRAETVVGTARWAAGAAPPETLTTLVRVEPSAAETSRGKVRTRV